MSGPKILAMHGVPDEVRALYAEHMTDADVTFLADVGGTMRRQAIADAEILLTIHLEEELEAEEFALLENVRFVQLLTAGVDHIPFSRIPAAPQFSGNAGVFSTPMAEHTLAMALAGAKRIVYEHGRMKDWEFNQFVPNKLLKGGVCGILGYGHVGAACAPLFRALGMEIHGVNRSGKADPAIDWIGTLDDTETLLRNSDVLIIAIALTTETDQLMGARELEWMKEDAILVNIARGEIVEQKALYDHLVAHPDFVACIEAWWIEPIRHGTFELDHPFLDLPNVVGSPHNSVSAPGSFPSAVRRGIANVRRYMAGEAPERIIRPDEKLR